MNDIPALASLNCHQAEFTGELKQTLTLRNDQGPRSWHSRRRLNSPVRILLVLYVSFKYPLLTRFLAFRFITTLEVTLAATTTATGYTTVSAAPALR